MTDYIIEKLDKQKHDRKQFDCGVDVLDVYLQTKAHQEQKKRLNVTYVAVLKNDNSDKKRIIAYYTLSNSAIVQAQMTPHLTKGVPPQYDIPTIKIGRLAIDKAYQQQGIGKMLLQDCFKKIIEISTLAGIRGIEVFAKNNDAKQLYEKYGFIKLLDNHNLLFLPMETLLLAVE